VIDELSAVAGELGSAAPAGSVANAGTVINPEPVSAPKQPPAGRSRLSPTAWGFITATVVVAMLGVMNLFRVGHSTTRDAPALPAPVGAGNALVPDSAKADSAPERDDNARETGVATVVDSSTPPERPSRADARVATKDPARPRISTSAAPTRITTTRVVLFVRSELRVASEIAGAALTEELRKGGYEVVDGPSAVGPLDEPGLASGTANVIARIGQANGAGSVLLIDASADARPFTESMFSGTAAVNVRVYSTSTGRLDTSQRFEIGTAQSPGELGPTESAAASAAVKAASYGAARFLVTALEKLR
jgi:hypothetical protein